MDVNSREILAEYEPALLENWYRHNYFNNEIDISGSGVEEYTFREIKTLANFTFDELDKLQVKDGATVGSFVVRTLLADLFGTGDADMVSVTNGANEGLQLVVRAILSPGDEIVTLGPCYHCHDKIALSMGCSVKKWVISPDNNFELNLDNLLKCITRSTRAVFLNFPHNPTGVGITQEMLNAVIEIVRSRDMYLVWDGVFQQLAYETPGPKDPIHQYEKTISLGTFSKAFGAPGLRFGWIIAPYNVHVACVRQKDYGNLFVAPMVEFVAEKMLANIQNFTTPKLKQAAQNREMVDHWLKHAGAELSWRKPDGGVCGLLKLPLQVNDYEFCNKLLVNKKVLLVPGSCFEIAGFARIGFGGNTQLLREGLDRLGQFTQDYKFAYL